MPRFGIRFEGPFSTGEQQLTTDASDQVAVISAGLVSGMGTPRYNRCRQYWFGSFDPGTIDKNIKRMDGVIRNPEITVTFVCRENKPLNAIYGGANVPPATVDRNDPTKANVGGRTVPLTNAHDPSLTTAYAFVFPAQRGGSGLMSHHVGSGIRLYLANVYTALPIGSEERSHTIYHELTHKTLGCEDHDYGAVNCRFMARRAPEKAGTNADNYAWFAITYAGLSATVTLP